MRRELDGIIDLKKLDEAIRLAREEDNEEEQSGREREELDTQERELLIEEPQPPGSRHLGGRRPKFTPAMDNVCYLLVRQVMEKKPCSLTLACELLADYTDSVDYPKSLLGRSAKGIARAYKRAYRREVFWSDPSKFLKTHEAGQ